MIVSLRALLPLLLLAAPGPVFAQPVECEAGSVDATNADGSRLRIRTRCGDDGEPTLELSSAPRGAGEFVPMPALASADPYADPPTSAYFEDLDKDGDQEIITRGQCGAGPNCFGEIYRWDRRTETLHRFLSEGWAELSFVDGHLVTAGRSSCCAWVFRAYRWDADEASGQEDLTIEVSAEFAEHGDQPEEISCTFSRRSGDAWQVVPPPSPAWLAICGFYDQPYHVVTADEAAATTQQTQFGEE